MSTKQEYIQIGLPDTKRLARLIEMGRGVNRTMAQYAEACGVSASTLSRIVNEKITKPVSTDLLKKLADNAEFPVLCSFESLLSANGMQDKKTYLARRARREMSYKLMEDRVCMANSAIASGLLMRGLKIQEIAAEDIGEKDNIFFPAIFNRYHKVYRVESENEAPFIWAFCIIPLVLKKDDDFDKLSSYMNSIIEKYATMLLQDTWAPASMQVDRISFVFIDIMLQLTFNSLMEKIPVNHYFTSVLISSDDKRVHDEEMVGNCQLSANPKLYFNESPIFYEDDNFATNFSDVEAGEDADIFDDPIQEVIDYYEIPDKEYADDKDDKK
ncbi:MAG: hypothetical protein ACOX6G_10905 [Christensenellales bacterium]|jgi:transcriptional regulator with XRE-family HTH domain